MRPPRRAARPRGLPAALAALTALAGLAVLASGCGAGTDTPAVGERLLPSGPPAHAAAGPTWAQGAVVHDGDRALRVPGLGRRQEVQGLVRTPYGFFLTLGTAREQHATAFFDGRTLTRLPGRPQDLEVSRDGRYAGWLDLDTSSRAGTATVVVVDLTTGRVVLRSHRGMGDPEEDDLADLYEDAEPSFAGFDVQDRAYWRAATGDADWLRAELTSGEVAAAAMVESGDGDRLEAQLWVAGHGWAITDHARQPGRRGTSAFLSPDRRSVVTTGITGRVWVDRLVGLGARRDATPAYGHRWVFFRGWVDPDAGTFQVLARDHFSFVWDTDGPDRTRGWLLTCRVGGGCQEVTEVVGTRSLVGAQGLGSEEV